MNETGKKSMLCPNCRKLISSDEPQCPYCGIANPGSAWKRYLGAGAAGGSMDIVSLIFYSNIAFYVFSIFLNPRGIGFAPNPFTFLSPSDQSLFLLGATGTYPVFFLNRWWTLVSASFLHGGLLHIFFNMAALRQLGPFVVQEYGSSRFTLIYILSGIAGFILSTAAGVPFTIGASAGLCGLIGAILYYGKSRGGFYGQAVYKQATGWVIGLILFGLLFPGINNWAHGGGIVTGALIGFAAGYEERRGENIGHKTLATACIVMTALILLWALLQAFYLRFF
jgi:rhomboid protease GluP